ncbi:MAG: hypothetical protein HYZ43_14900 [Flavobacteriia bacterium]|nr:hypothetical protein [Flavobacteriia bacterium]
MSDLWSMITTIRSTKPCFPSFTGLSACQSDLCVYLCPVIRYETPTAATVIGYVISIQALLREEHHL